MWRWRLITTVVVTPGSLLLTDALYRPWAMQPQGLTFDALLAATILNTVWCQWALTYVVGPKRSPLAVGIAISAILAMIFTCGIGNAG
jgi:hypothetical protein